MLSCVDVSTCATETLLGGMRAPSCGVQQDAKVADAPTAAALHVGVCARTAHLPVGILLSQG